VLLVTACDNQHKNPKHDAAVILDAEVPDAEPDASVLDAGLMDASTDGGGAPFKIPVKDQTAAGGRSSSEHFVVFSTTGESTPVSQGREKSQTFSVSPGIVGGK
jgi:hypothetical protein